jgi:hypothetical protein
LLCGEREEPLARDLSECDAGAAGSDDLIVMNCMLGLHGFAIASECWQTGGSSSTRKHFSCKMIAPR